MGEREREGGESERNGRGRERERERGESDRNGREEGEKEESLGVSMLVSSFVIVGVT
jgi:hypothetical protein